VRALLDIQLLGHGGIDITSEQGGSAGVVTPSARAKPSCWK
jgi:hypothetical protein